jgi:hypothetical protein
MEPIGYLFEGRLQEKAARMNEAVLKQNSQQALAESGAAVEAQSRNIQQLMGRQRAAIAQAGGGFGGSAEDVARQSAAEAELDLLNTQYEGQMRSRGLLAEAQQERFRGVAAKRVSYLRAYKSFSDAAAKAASGSGGGG